MTRPGSSVRSIRRTRPLSSAVTIALTVLAFKFVGDAIGSRVLLGSWMMIVPPVTLIQLVPISLPGWGFGKPRWLSRSVRLGSRRGGAGDLGSGRSLSDPGGLAPRFDLACGLGYCSIT
jgi:hypothetical protein